MSRYSLFQMDRSFREFLIDRHEFYLKQAQSRLLSQFGDISGDADQAGREWLEQRSHNFDPDRDDEGSVYESAHEESIAFYSMLTDMHEQTRLSVVAGMFHEWDKQFREWTVLQSRFWHGGDEVAAKIWAQTSDNLAEFFAHFGWDYRKEAYYDHIDACRLVVNVYKHGSGSSFDDLKKRHPRYLVNSISTFIGDEDNRYVGHQDLKVSDDDILAFSQAITAFWRGVPESIFDDSAQGAPPQWLRKAFEKDQKN